MSEFAPLPGQKLQPSPSLKDVEWSVDRLVQADGMLCAMGWCASRKNDRLAVALLMIYPGGEEVRFPLDCTQDRPDVPARLPGLSPQCGFFLYVPIASDKTPKRVIMEFVCGEADPVRVVLPYGEAEGEAPERWKRSLIVHYCRRLFAHLRQGNWGLIYQRIRGNLPALLAKTTSDDDLEQRLGVLPPDTLLVIDHALGGGANHYRDEMIDKYSRDGRFVLLWTFSVLTLSHQLSFIASDGRKTSVKIDLSVWDRLIRCRKISGLVFNNCVSFPKPEEFPDRLVRFVQAYPGERRLTMLVHDFFTVCPSHFLLNHQGRYCGLPGIETCRRCLPALDDPLANLFSAKNMELWRALWATAFEHAAEIICFSENTQSLLLKAYPDLPRDHLRIVPHKVDYLSGRYAGDPSSSRLRVAMVGQIGKHKGSEEYISLIETARQRGYPIDFYVIGSLNGSVKPPEVIETGTYQRNDLADLFNRNKIRMVLMLSIWPETFSYVTHELIKLGIPLLSYDIGAQGDAVREYALGKTVPLGSDANALLDCIDSFRLELERPSRDPASMIPLVSNDQKTAHIHQRCL